MSHTVKIQTEFKDFRCLKKAFKALGWEIKENSTMRTYPNDPDKNKVWKYVAVNPKKENVYDLGIDVSESGKIEIFGDFFGGSVAAALGSGLSKLKQNYAVKVVEEELEPLGFMTNLTHTENGYIVMECEKPS